MQDERWLLILQVMSQFFLFYKLLRVYHKAISQFPETYLYILNWILKFEWQDVGGKTRNSREDWAFWWSEKENDPVCWAAAHSCPPADAVSPSCTAALSNLFYIFFISISNISFPVMKPVSFFLMLKQTLCPVLPCRLCFLTVLIWIQSCADLGKMLSHRLCRNVSLGLKCKFAKDFIRKRKSTQTDTRKQEWIKTAPLLREMMSIKNHRNASKCDKSSVL